MADNIVGGLFGMTPELLQAQRNAQLEQQAANFVNNYGDQGAMFGYKLGSTLGRGIGGMLGAQDPEMVRIKQRQQMLQGLDINDPQSLMKAAQAANQAGDTVAAQELYNKAQQSAQAQATLGKTQAETKKVELTVAQEEKLRSELASLGPNATEQDMLSVITKYGSPDKIMAVLQGAQARREAATARLEAAKTAADARIEAARLAGATAKEIAQMRIDSSKELANIRAETSAEKAAAKKEAERNAPLPASLQKDESKDLEVVDAASAQQEALAPVISALTPDATGVRKLNLSPIKIAEYNTRNAVGNSTPESRAYANLKSSVDTAVNLQVSAEKGVQTDKDVLRFAKALIAAYAGNDSQATLEALTKYNDAIKKSAERTKERIESRRKSQNVRPYFEQQTPQEPKKPTKRWNPATGTLETI